MKRLILLIAALTVVTLIPEGMAQRTPATNPDSPAPAAPQKTKAAPATTEKAKMEKFIGKVSSMDGEAKTVVVKRAKAEMTFTVGGTTKITSGGKEMAFADLKQGMDVAISYKMEADKAIAAVITVSLPRPTSESTPRRTVERSGEEPAK